MKNAISIMALFLCLSSAVMAQMPQPPVPFGTGGFNETNGRTTQNTVKGAGNPIAPATLLLLGLAGGFAGVKIYRNSKKEEE